MIEMVVRDGMLGPRDCRGNFRWEDRHEVFTQAENAEIDKQIKTATNQRNLIDPIRYTIEGLDGTKIPVDIYAQRGHETTPLLRVRFCSKEGDPHFDSRPYMRKHFKAGDVLSLKSTGTRSLKITAKG